MIQINLDKDGPYETASYTYDAAVQLAVDPNAWFDIEYESATSRGRELKRTAFPAASVVKIEPLPY